MILENLVNKKKIKKRCEAVEKLKIMKLEKNLKIQCEKSRSEYSMDLKKSYRKRRRNKNLKNTKKDCRESSKLKHLIKFENVKNLKSTKKTTKRQEELSPKKLKNYRKCREIVTNVAKDENQ